MKDKGPHIPRRKFTQYFTDIFIRNNQASLRESVHALAFSTGIDAELLDFDDIIDKAVYAAITDMYSCHMMEKQDSIADLVKNHLFSIVISQTSINDK